MKPCHWIVILALVFVGKGAAADEAAAREFVRGVDLSSLPKIEEGGGVFKVEGEAGDALEILAERGVNLVRLRVWHNPLAGQYDRAATLAMAARVKALGLGLLIDVHYSDSWADPGHQTIPAAWSGLALPALADSVFQYTHDVVAALHAQGSAPDMVQVGNEIGCGMLWDVGRVCGGFDTPSQWANLAALLGAGVQAVRAVSPATQVLIHVEHGGNRDASAWFFDHLTAHGVDFDVIALSFYPWWHGSLHDLRLNLDALARSHEQPILLVETAYPWTLLWNDATHNSVGLESQLHPGHAATVEGQRRFLGELMDVVADVAAGRGLGLVYWEPAWISAPGSGSPWENLSWFDFEGELTSAIEVFRSGISKHESAPSSP